MSLRERAVTCNTLVCLLKSLEHRITTIELKNDSSVTGKIESVDAYMNVHMIDVVFVAPDDSNKHFKNFFVQGRQLRYVHIPDDLDITSAIQSNLTAIRNKSSLTLTSKWPKKKQTIQYVDSEKTDSNLSKNVT